MSEQDVEHHHDPLYSWLEPGVKRWRGEDGAYSSLSLRVNPFLGYIYIRGSVLAKANHSFSRITRYLTVERPDGAVRAYHDWIEISKFLE